LNLRDLFKPRAYRTALPSADRDTTLMDRAATALQQGDCATAIRLYDEVLAQMPDNKVAHYKRANAFNALGQWRMALAGYDRAIECDPGYAEAYCNRGTVLESLGRFLEALHSYDRAVALKPDDFLAFYNRGSALRNLRRFEDALDSYDRATSLKADYSEAYINRGHVLQQLERHEAAVASYERAIELNPGHPEAFASRGFSLVSLKRNQDAIASFDRAIELKADFRYLIGMRRYAKMAICDWKHLTEDLQQIARGLVEEKPVSHPFPILALFDSPHLHRLAAQIWAREEHPAVEPPAVQAARRHQAKIRLGYFSADFRHHPVSLLSAELFEMHDRSKFEVTGFAFGPPATDAMRARLKQAFDRFEDVSHLTDLDVALLARDYGIDIAVDLGGYTDHSRTKIFAFRAAPVQMSYIGYLGTMGAPYMDYLVADATIIPACERKHYSERIIYLPSYQVNDSKKFCALRSFSREELGIPAAGFVFCCFNSNYKIMPATFSTWMRILHRVPGSVLFLYAENAVAGQNLRTEAMQHGIDSLRIILGAHLAMPEYLARYRTMDLFLDTLPYNAGATASDALWAGLPVLTCMGQSFASRVAASLLNALDLPELITSTLQNYEDRAVRLATHPDELASIREKLARNRHVKPLFDTACFTRNLETAYSAIHQRSQRGLSPEDVQVGALMDGMRDATDSPI
jgi:predicted O-linked N-acetylglucosamine transferase (SPINDLY family)